MEKAHLQLRNYTNFIDDIQYRQKRINYVCNQHEQSKVQKMHNGKNSGIYFNNRTDQDQKMGSNTQSIINVETLNAM